MSVPSAIIIALIVLRWLHASKCNFHICCNFSWARYACLQKTENLSISVLKTHWLLPVFGGFLKPTGSIRNGLLREFEARTAPDLSRDPLAPSGLTFCRRQWEPSRYTLTNPFFVGSFQNRKNGLPPSGMSPKMLLLPSKKEFALSSAAAFKLPLAWKIA